MINLSFISDKVPNMFTAISSKINTVSVFISSGVSVSLL